MPIVDYPYSLLRGLSDFWTRFFADADQLDALYKGTAVQLGQAYLDLMSATLGISLKDAVAFDKEFYRLLTIREDEIAFSEGATLADDRWVFELPSSIVSFAMLDNRVVEPTVSLEPNRDYEIVDGAARFRVDPTDPVGDGIPLAGFARRALDVEVGGTFTDTAVASWTATNVRKGDTLRLLDVGTDGAQRKRTDHNVVLVRAAALYVAAATPFPSTIGVKYVVLRVPAVPKVLAESFTTAASQATFAHTRIDQGSARVYAKGPTGADVVEGVDYALNYESGTIVALTTWLGMSGGVGTFAIDYSWREEVRPMATTGVVSALAGVVRVLQMALWAPDTLVDRMTLANNFGSFIGRMKPSSEAYRAFLAGVFQLYVLGPVLQRVESALNVVLGFPVVRDDGEVFQSIDTSDALVDRVLTTRPSTGLTAVYTFPKGTPFRADLTAGLVLESFEPLTTVVTVTDYVQTPNWWHGAVIPAELFSVDSGSTPPPVQRRTASASYVLHVAGAADDPHAGDPGLIAGADETGFIPPPGHPVFRHRLAFVLMDRYLKYHTFSVKFDALAVSAAVGAAFAQSLKDLNDLVLASKPSHTFAFTAPTTFFRDEVQVTEDPISFNRLVGSRVNGPDKIIYTDDAPIAGSGIWLAGDYFKYELFTVSTAFPVISTPVTLANAPVAPRHGRLVRVFVNGAIGGKALVENVDYTVDYPNRTVTRLTAWTATTVNVTYRQLNIGNVVDASIGSGDMPILAGGVDPALITAAFSASAAGWDGVIEGPTAPRDIGLVERALIVHPH